MDGLRKGREKPIGISVKGSVNECLYLNILFIKTKTTKGDCKTGLLVYLFNFLNVLLVRMLVDPKSHL